MGKHVLLVRKRTNLERHGENFRVQLARGRFNNQRTYEHLERSHAEHEACFSAIQNFLKDFGARVSITKRENLDEDCKKYDLIITVGGDGTLLSVARQLISKDHPPILGVRSSSDSVGYLCGTSFEGFEEVLTSVMVSKREPEVMARFALEVDPSEGEPWSTPPVLNDILYANIHPAATTRYLIDLKGASEKHKSSGIWVSTAIGSTAALSAAGGQTMQRADKRCQYRVRELYTIGEGEMHLSGGFFDPEKDSWLVTNFSESAIVAMDGTHGEIKLKYGDKIKVVRAESLLMFV